MYKYHPEGLLWYLYYSRTKSVFLISFFFKYFPLIPRFRLIHIFRVLEYTVYSVFQNIPYIPCFRIIRVFRILEYSVCSAIPLRHSVPPFRHSTIPPNRVTRLYSNFASFSSLRLQTFLVFSAGSVLSSRIRLYIEYE